MPSSSQHSFHIPVMGLAYTIDTPIKVARFGISSVISIVENKLIEMMRSHYYPSIHQEYVPINIDESDYRAKRITDYLNLVNSIVQRQMEILRDEAFTAGTEMMKYIEMLPMHSYIRQLYQQMEAAENSQTKHAIEIQLRKEIKPGSIDVNIMTKLDRNNLDAGGIPIEDGSDAVAALRGFAKSNLTNSSVIFSAGLNPRLYNYLEQCKEFDCDQEGHFTKKITIKVSDYRSALIQGKYLAKKGIWVSEFRIESGLNCGGHAFATDGYLLGPILEEFAMNRQALKDTLFSMYALARENKKYPVLQNAPQILFSVQGGIGTQEEDIFLHDHYQINSTGWGTPFLLVPEATTVDKATLELLCKAKKDDIELSHNSPLGIRYHYLKRTTAEIEKLHRIKKGNPGSPCTEKHLSFNTEFTKEPICTASKQYQKLKIAQLQALDLPEPEYKKQLNDVIVKECLCVGLSNPAAINYEKILVKKMNAVTICPGPNIVNFSNIVSLQTMVDHIYGRVNIITNPARPHMFIAELNLYIDYLQEQLEEAKLSNQVDKMKKYFSTFYGNLRKGISYYFELTGLSDTSKIKFTEALYYAGIELDFLQYQYTLQENQ